MRGKLTAPNAPNVNRPEILGYGYALALSSFLETSDTQAGGLLLPFKNAGERTLKPEGSNSQISNSILAQPQLALTEIRNILPSPSINTLHSLKLGKLHQPLLYSSLKHTTALPLG